MTSPTTRTERLDVPFAQIAQADVVDLRDVRHRTAYYAVASMPGVDADGWDPQWMLLARLMDCSTRTARRRVDALLAKGALEQTTDGRLRCVRRLDVLTDSGLGAPGGRKARITRPTLAIAQHLVGTYAVDVMVALDMVTTRGRGPATQAEVAGVFDSDRKLVGEAIRDLEAKGLLMWTPGSRYREDDGTVAQAPSHVAVTRLDQPENVPARFHWTLAQTDPSNVDEGTEQVDYDAMEAAARGRLTEAADDNYPSGGDRNYPSGGDHNHPSGGDHNHPITIPTVPTTPTDPFFVADATDSTRKDVDVIEVEAITTDADFGIDNDKVTNCNPTATATEDDLIVDAELVDDTTNDGDHLNVLSAAPVADLSLVERPLDTEDRRTVNATTQAVLNAYIGWRKANGIGRNPKTGELDGSLVNPSWNAVIRKAARMLLEDGFAPAVARAATFEWHDRAVRCHVESDGGEELYPMAILTIGRRWAEHDAGAKLHGVDGTGRTRKEVEADAVAAISGAFAETGW